MKKIIGILVCMLFIGASILPSISGNFEEKQNIKKLDYNVLDYTDHFILDQHQDDFNPKGGTLVEYNLQKIAQSFKPSITSLAKVDLAIGSSTELNSPLFVSIRTELDGAILTSITVPASEIPTDMEWYAFDFTDISVIPENTYYIQIEEEASENGYGYSLGEVMGQGFDFYSRGMQLGYWDHGTEGWYWENSDVYGFYFDLAFRTYKFNNTPPEKPTITGKSSGRPDKEYQYIFVSTDPENDYIEYCIDWGDDTAEVWIDPNPSGFEVSTTHIWLEQGNYTIKAKAKDTYGAESEWAILEVSMPKTHNYNSILELLLKMWERFLFFEKILKQ